MKQAFVTLLSSEDYLIPVLILNKNLKDLKSQYPLVVMVTENIRLKVQNYLKKENILWRSISNIEYSQIIKEQHKNSYLLNIASKLGIFTLIMYDKLVYIDADSIFYKNIDNLFIYPDGAMYVEPGEQNGFTGLFVCSPLNHNLENYRAILQNRPIFESDLLGELWFPFKSNEKYRIPTEYFINITLENFDEYKLDQIYGVHFCYFYKPWKYKSPQDYLIDFYSKFTIKSQRRDLVIQAYFDYYLTPLKQKYPELFE